MLAMKNNQPGTILEIKDLDINLGGKEIIKNVSLDIEENEIVGIVGVSGAGKTT
ncbi:MAG: ABC transporter related protein, partial [Parcubacteria group bacterium GW2011_GWA1_48_11b]